MPIILALSSLGFLFGGDDVARVTPDQWREDVRFLAQELPKRHKNAFHNLPRGEFTRRLNRGR